MLKGYLFITFALAILLSCNTKKEAKSDLAWKAKADSLVSLTFDTLRNTLLKAVSEKGFAGAVAFCNTEATDLINTYATEKITIRRSSDRVRNTANAPDSFEQKILFSFRRMIKENKELKAITEKDGTGNRHYFKPILLQAMCLNCHGNRSTQIKPDVWATIQQKYPADSAFNYKEGDLRGIWHVTYKSPDQ